MKLQDANKASKKRTFLFPFFVIFKPIKLIFLGLFTLFYIPLNILFKIISNLINYIFLGILTIFKVIFYKKKKILIPNNNYSVFNYLKEKEQTNFVFNNNYTVFKYKPKEKQEEIIIKTEKNIPIVLEEKQIIHEPRKLNFQKITIEPTKEKNKKNNILIKMIINVLFLFTLKYVFVGFIVISYLVYKILFYILKGVALPFDIIRVVNKKASLKNEKDKFEKLLRKAQEKLLKEQLKEDEEREKIRSRKRKIEKEIGKKEVTREDIYSDKKYVIKKKPLLESIADFFIKIKNIPNSIKEKYNNSLFVRNQKNKYNIEREALLMNFEGEDAEKSDVKLLYEYVAKNEEGKTIKGYFEAFSKVEVHSFLLSENYEVYSIRTSKWIRLMYGNRGTSHFKIKHKDLIFFLTQLSTYIKAGIPLVEALKILSRQFKNRNYQNVFKSIMYDLTMGDNFSDALEKQGSAFPKLLINMVKAAEMTGELPEALDDMAEYFTESEKTRKQMVTAMMYPAIVFTFAMAAITFILMFVVPKFVEIYESMDASKIPEFTKFVVKLSAFIQNYIIYIIIGVIVLIVLYRYLFKNVKMFRTINQWLFMHFPVFGDVIIFNEVTMFTKTFGSLLSHNVFITNSMEVLNKITTNEIYKMLILDTIDNLAKGEKISLAFKDHWAFPIPAYEMLLTGERTGELPEMMKKVSSYYQELHKNAVARIKTFLEPALLIFLTVVVGGIVLSIVIPMFGFYDLGNQIG